LSRRYLGNTIGLPMPEEGSPRCPSAGKAAG
jgi:hypothetical protein